MPLMTTHVPGTFCWPELCSADVLASKKFYTSLFGWHSSDIHMPAGDYTLLKLDNQRVWAMYQMTEHRKIAGVLPHWNSYVAVISADETARNTTALGGTVLREPFGADANRMANLQDPTGAKFCIWKIKPATARDSAQRSRNSLLDRTLHARSRQGSGFLLRPFGLAPATMERGCDAVHHVQSRR